MLSGAGKNIGAEKEKNTKYKKICFRADAFTLFRTKKADQVGCSRIKKAGSGWLFPH